MAVTRLELKPDPSNRDLQEQIAELHDCQHQLADEVRRDRHASKNRDQTLTASMSLLTKRMADLEQAHKDGATAAMVQASAVADLAGRVKGTETGVELLVQFFKVQPSAEGKRPRRRVSLANVEWWQAVVTIITSILGALSAWKYLFPALQALHHALLTK